MADENNKEIIKFKGTFNRQFFPKDNEPYNNGEYAIISFGNIEPIEGNVEEHLHEFFNTITVLGNFPYIHDISKTYIIMCETKEDPHKGKQNRLLMITEDINLDSIENQKIFLQSSGLTEIQIKNLYQTFENPIEIIISGDIEKLCNVKGIGETTAKKIIEKIEENKDYSEAYVELSGYDISPHMIQKLSDAYGSPIILINKIKENPYILTEIDGVGFVKADKIALASGYNKFSQNRLRAFISHILNEGAMEGYSWISSTVLVNKIQEELDDYPIEEIVQAVKFLKEKRVIWDGEFGKVALQKYYELERKIRDELLRIKNGQNNFIFDGWEERVLQAEKLQGWEYTDEQKQAIKMVLENQLSIITGKAGSGKTSTALGSIKALGEVSFGQCCLSGKGAARIQEATGYEAYTIHRLLGYSPSFDDEGEGSLFIHNAENPLELNVVLLDEFAMCGGYLFLDLLKAISTGSKFILLGDPSQLPAIGCLNIGSDLTFSSHVATTILTKIHRQAQKSAIITESIKISEGEQIIDKDFMGKEIRGELQDLELDIYKDNSLTVSKVIEHFKEKLSWCNDINEVQVIVPMSMRGDSSVYNLNNLIQPIYNPASDNKKEVYLPLENDKGYTLRVGDKIINMKNNYRICVVEKDEVWDTWFRITNEDNTYLTVAVFNGFTGEIVDIQDNNLIIYFPLIEKTVLVESSHWKGEKAIHLAYALTCHKCQGSAFKYVIAAIDYSHYKMLKDLGRELVYTMITRTSKFCTLVAENKALRFATKNSASQNKQTFLPELLEEAA